MAADVLMFRGVRRGASALHSAFRLCRVGELLKSCDPAIAQAPDMRELCVKSDMGRFVGTTITARDDNSVSSVDEFGRDGLKMVPLGCEAKEDSFGHSGGAKVGIPIRIGEVLRFIPNDSRVQHRKSSRTVAAIDCSIKILHEIEIGCRHGKAFQKSTHRKRLERRRSI